MFIIPVALALAIDEFFIKNDYKLNDKKPSRDLNVYVIFIYFWHVNSRIHQSLINSGPAGPSVTVVTFYGVWELWTLNVSEKANNNIYRHL